MYSVSVHLILRKGEGGREGEKGKRRFTYPAKQGDLSGLRHICAELVVEVGSGHVEKHELHPEGGPVLDGHDIRHVVAGSRLESRGRPGGHLALLDEIPDVALWGGVDEKGDKESQSQLLLLLLPSICLICLSSLPPSLPLL